MVYLGFVSALFDFCWAFFVYGWFGVLWVHLTLILVYWAVRIQDGSGFQ